MQQTIILCPLYNDEQSFNLFAAGVENIIQDLPSHQFRFLVVNDGSGKLNLKTKLPLTILNLHRNLGHQKAIAIGMAYAHHHLKFNQLLVMDGDGEDRPEDIPTLIHASADSEKIIVGKRASRKENRSFRSFYLVYKILFRILTGKEISFGNFMLIPLNASANLVHYSEIWNNLAGAVIKSGIPFTAVNTHKGRRYAGTSNMNFTSLLLHGLGAIGVFIEIIASRLMMFSLVMILISMTAIIIIILVKLFTDLAIPGWATGAVTSMLIVLLQSFLLSLFTLFLYLSSQGQRKFIPALHYEDYLQSAENYQNG